MLKFKEYILKNSSTHFRKLGLTESESEVAKYATVGLSDKEISVIRDREIKTTKFHMNNIHKKLNIHSRNELLWKLPLEILMKEFLNPPKRKYVKKLTLITGKYKKI